MLDWSRLSAVLSPPRAPQPLTGSPSAGRSLNSAFGILGLVLVAFALRLIWAWILPYNSGPDEYMHVRYLSFLAAHRRMPDPAEILRARGGAYAATSPVPYLPALLTGGLLGASPNFSAHIFAPRLGMAAIGAATVWAAALAAREFFAELPWLTWGVPALMAAEPQFVFTGSYVNSDGVTNLAAVLVVWAWAVLWRKGLSPRRMIGLGAAAGLDLLSKPTGWGLLAVTPLLLVLAGRRHGLRLFDLLKGCAPAAGVCAIMAGPFLVRNAVVLHGDIVGSRTMWQVMRVLFPSQMRPSMAAQGKAFGYLWTHTPFLDLLYHSYWGLFGYMSLPMSECVYWLIGVPCFLALVGTGFCMVGRRATEPSREILWVFALAIALDFGLSAWTSWANDFQPQGRYLFASLLPEATLMLVGLTWFGRSPRVKTTLAILAVVGIFALDAYALLQVIGPAYGR